MRVKNFILFMCFMFIVYPISAISSDWTMQVVPPETEQFQFNAIWGSSGSDIFVVGEGGCILHYDGSSWNGGSTANSGIFDVWGTSTNNVFAFSREGNGSILHYDGTTWSVMKKWFGR
jgi:hypothetical protein